MVFLEKEKGIIEACHLHMGVLCFLPLILACKCTLASPCLQLKGGSALAWFHMLMPAVMHRHHNELLSAWLLPFLLTLLVQEDKNFPVSLNSYMDSVLTYWIWHAWRTSFSWRKIDRWSHLNCFYFVCPFILIMSDFRSHTLPSFQLVWLSAPP